MMWSKVKSNLENKFAENLKGRVQIYITSYGHGFDTTDLFNRGWITVDGKEVVNFSTPDTFYLNGANYHYATPTNCATSDNQLFEERDSHLLSEKGEFSKFDLSNCCYAYLDLSIEEALNHKSPIINMLSVLDRRAGKRRLLRLIDKTNHPLVNFFLSLRLERNVEKK